MALHPNERPSDMKTFRQALLGNAVRSNRLINPKKHAIRDYLRLPVEKALLFTGIALLLISFVVSIFR